MSVSGATECVYFSDEHGLLDQLATLRRRWWMLPVAPVLFFFVASLFAHFAAFHGWIELSLWFTDWATILLNIALLAVIALLFYALTNRLRLACGMALALACVASLTHWLKVAVRGGPLYPWDLLLVGETAHVMDWGALRGYWPNLLLLAVAVPAVVITWLLLPRLGPARVAVRLAIGAACLAFFASLFVPGYSALKPFRNRILQMTWNPNHCYARAGVLLAFSANVQDYVVPAPEGYSARAVLDIYDAADLAREDGATASGEPGRAQPPAGVRGGGPINLILVLSESFSNPTALGGVTFGSDPIPTFRQIARDGGRVDLITPVFGGGTCDAELEVLTGCNMAFFPPGVAPYKSYIRQPLPSLASELRQQGYLTLALHAVVKSYFNDCQVQPRLGFEQLHPATRWQRVEKIQHYVTDASTSREVIYKADEASASGKPFFICVNTMETHWPFPADRYYNRTELADLEAPHLSPASRETLETYVCGLRRADQALAMLVEHFRDDPRPTMIVFYGDHLPALGLDNAVWRQTGLWRQGGDPLTLRTVPAVFWSNCGLALPPHQPKRMSMCYLAPLILQTMGQPRGPFFRFLETCRQRYPVFSVSGCLDAAGRAIPLADVLAGDLARDYRMLQYDRVFGEQHFRALTGPPPPSDPQNPFAD